METIFKATKNIIKQVESHVLLVNCKDPFSNHCWQSSRVLKMFIPYDNIFRIFPE